MEYRIAFAQANERIVTDLPKATMKLSEEVAKMASEGWRPQGGVAVLTAPASQGVFLLQALVHD